MTKIPKKIFARIVRNPDGFELVFSDLNGNSDEYYVTSDGLVELIELLDDIHECDLKMMESGTESTAPVLQ